jgi:predicted DNA-binding transcriptional regulator AlpA
MLSIPERPPSVKPAPACDDFLTAGDLADRMQVCKQTVRNWVKRGLLPPPVRMGRRSLRWRAAQVREFLLRRQEAADYGNSLPILHLD